MGIRFFRGEKIRFEHEYHQLKEIVELLRKEYQKEPVYILTNVLVANRQLDCVLLTRSGPIILELKAFSGRVHGLENGPWDVMTKDGNIPLPNLFVQAKLQRQDLIDRLIPIYDEHLPHINGNNLRKLRSWIYFSRGTVYPDGQIDFRRVKWFRIVTADSLLETMRFPDSGYTLRIQDMDAIVNGLHLEEYELSNGHSVAPAPAETNQSTVLSKRLLAAIVIGVVIGAIILLLFLVPSAKVAFLSSVNGIITVVGGLISQGSREFIKVESTPADSQEAMIYLNQIRVSGGILPVPFDEQAYQLAIARAEDMATYRYLDYKNPETGSTAILMKSRFGINPWDLIIECAYGQWNGYTFGIEKDAIDAWLTDEGNRDRLFSPIDRGAIACSHGYCSFIGISPQPKSLTDKGEPVFVEQKEVQPEVNVTGTVAQ